VLTERQLRILGHSQRVPRGSSTASQSIHKTEDDVYSVFSHHDDRLHSPFAHDLAETYCRYYCQLLQLE
jgi:hypothetical protein